MSLVAQKSLASSMYKGKVMGSVVVQRSKRALETGRLTTSPSRQHLLRLLLALALILAGCWRFGRAVAASWGWLGERSNSFGPCFLPASSLALLLLAREWCSCC